MKSLRRIKRWFTSGLLRKENNYWEFHTLKKKVAEMFVITVCELHGDVYTVIEEDLIICTLTGTTEKPGYVIYCNPLT